MIPVFENFEKLVKALSGVDIIGMEACVRGVLLTTGDARAHDPRSTQKTIWRSSVEVPWSNTCLWGLQEPAANTRSIRCM